MEVRPTRDAGEVELAIRLRERVFCDEQGVDPSLERDDRDREALHLVALDGARIVGTCRILVDGELGRLGRMAVEAERRRAGIGAALLEAGEAAARSGGARRMRLHAQVAARDFYARAGYESRGGPFVEDGIDHVTMERPLA